MSAEPPDSPVTEAVGSLEVRWIFPGQLQAAVARWFGRFPAGMESREDTYLLDPPLRGLSVKIRGGGVHIHIIRYIGGPQQRSNRSIEVIWKVGPLVPARASLCSEGPLPPVPRAASIPTRTGW
jgi:hypothetical protein